MNIFKRSTLKSKIEKLLVKQTELSEFLISDIFRTEIRTQSGEWLQVVKLHNIVTIYMIDEPFGHIGDSPSVTLSVSESGKWKYIAKHRHQNLIRKVNAA